MSKKFIWGGFFVGSFLGGYVPSLWGAGSLSGWGILFSFLGAIAGIWVGYRIARSM